VSVTTPPGVTLEVLVDTPALVAPKLVDEFD
jgi:hypothetical protein